MGKFTVTPEALISIHFKMKEKSHLAASEFESLIESLSAVDEYLINSKIADIKSLIANQNKEVLSAFTNFNRHIDKLLLIADEYEQAERENKDESDTIH